jgi:hypothetical protein
MVERIEEAFPDAKKRESDELTLGAWEFVPGKRGMTRKQLFAKIGVEEKRLGRPNRGFFNDLKFATWQLSHSYSISIAYTVVSPVQDADSDDEVIAVYTVVIIKADKDSVFGP